MRKFTDEEITKIQEVREMISSICGPTHCHRSEPCPLIGEGGCMEEEALEILDIIICYAEQNRGES